MKANKNSSLRYLKDVNVDQIYRRLNDEPLDEVDWLTTKSQVALDRGCQRDMKGYEQRDMKEN